MIKGSGIGTSATRAEILKKLVNISYLDLNKKTQIITPTLKGRAGLRYRAVFHPRDVKSETYGKLGKRSHRRVRWRNQRK